VVNVGGSHFDDSRQSPYLYDYYNKLGYWRRRRDSNPRTSYPVTPLAGERLRPLGHVSIDPFSGRFWEGQGEMLGKCTIHGACTKCAQGVHWFYAGLGVTSHGSNEGTLLKGRDNYVSTFRSKFTSRNIWTKSSSSLG
jgi:hypothetical protein